jgi:hypothetical protein
MLAWLGRIINSRLASYKAQQTSTTTSASTSTYFVTKVLGPIPGHREFLLEYVFGQKKEPSIFLDRAELQLQPLSLEQAFTVRLFTFFFL